MKKRVPKYRRHPSGSAFVECGGKRIYLGRYGTDSSRKRYRRFLEQLEVAAVVQPVKVAPPESRTVSSLIVLYLLHAKAYYVDKNQKTTKEYGGMEAALVHLDLLHGEELGWTYGPLLLNAFQEYLVGKGYSRKFVNKTVGRVKRMFRWCSKQELVPPTLYQGLMCVEGLKRGRTIAPERPKITGVPQEVVGATIPWTSPVVADLIQVQFWCGMRPSEACQMKLRYIDRSRKVWLYAPLDHKNGWRGITRVIAIPKVAQEILAKYLDRGDDEYLFSPREAERIRNDAKTGTISPDRKTKVYRCEIKRRAKAKVKRRATAFTRLRHHYDCASYRRAITYAIRKAGQGGVTIPHWHPNQLRHEICQTVSRAHGRQAAQYWLGHEHLETTEIYDEKKISDLVAIAQKVDEIARQRRAEAAQANQGESTPHATRTSA